MSLDANGVSDFCEQILRAWPQWRWRATRNLAHFSFLHSNSTVRQMCLDTIECHFSETSFPMFHAELAFSQNPINFKTLIEQLFRSTLQVITSHGEVYHEMIACHVLHSVYPDNIHSLLSNLHYYCRKVLTPMSDLRLIVVLVDPVHTRNERYFSCILNCLLCHSAQICPASQNYPANWSSLQTMFHLSMEFWFDLFAEFAAFLRESRSWGFSLSN